MAQQFPFSVDVVVRGYELDPWGHVNNSVYLNWLEHARWELGASTLFDGFGSGIMPVVRYLELDYQVETRLGDELKISIWPRSVGNTSMTLGSCIRIMSSRDKTRVGKIALLSKQVLACIKRPGGKVPVPTTWRVHFPAEDPGEQLPVNI